MTVVDHSPTVRLSQMVASDLRWSFTRPFTWLSGVVCNLVLSLLYLVVSPLTGQPHRDWAILVGTYFAVFILADVTTTNVLGADSHRIRASLRNATPLWRILLSKNLSLLLIVGLPTVLATAVITLDTEAGVDLFVTVPGVLFPVLTWLGVGNLVSVLLPVSAQTLRERWRHRRNLKLTGRWLFALALPYALCLVVDPTRYLPRMIAALFAGYIGHGIEQKAVILTCLGVALYLLGSAAALTVARHREIRL